MGQIQYITVGMTQMDSLWFSNPTQAYRGPAGSRAAGADRRPLSARSIIQHQAMFEHFRRHLLARGTTIASFGTADVDAFWQTPNGRTYSQATRMRYVKLLDRLAAHKASAVRCVSTQRSCSSAPVSQSRCLRGM